MASQVNSFCPPKAKSKGLIVEQAGSEMLVYNRENHHVHSLNETAARVWNHCDGETSPVTIAKLLKVDEKFVWDALEQLGRNRLLEEKIALPPKLAGMTRRQHLRALGRVAAVAVPLVTAMMAPVPAMAASLCGGTVCSGGTTHCCCNPNCHCTSNCGGACPNKVTCS
jgi:hypothetical protein